MNIYITGLNYSINDADLNDLLQSMEKLHLQKLSWIEKQEDPEDLVLLKW